MKKITLFIFLLGFLLFRPYQLERYGMMYPGDDRSYFAFTSAIVFGQYPKISSEHELVDEFSSPPLSRVGPGLFAAPLAFVFSIPDRITHHPIVQNRTLESIASSWTIVGSYCTSVLIFSLACLLLFKTLRLNYSQKTTEWTIFFMVLTQGLAIYVFRRPVFSHVYELFFQSLGFFLLFYSQKNPSVLKKSWFYTTCIALVLGIVLVRQNGLPYALWWPFLIFIWNGKKNWKKFITAFGIGFGLYLFIKYIPQYFHPKDFIDSNKTFETTDFLFRFERPYFYFKRLFTVFLGLDWGLVYTAPFLVLGLVGLGFKKQPQHKLVLLSTLPLLVNFYLVVIWKGQGSYYGYRYLLFSAIPVLLYPFAFLFEKAQKKKNLFYALLALSILPLSSMILYETNDLTELYNVVTEFGERNVGNLTYQLGVWKILLHHPKLLFFGVFKGGAVYWVHYFFNLFGLGHLLSDRFTNMYPRFDWTLGLKCIFVYVAIWLPYWCSFLGLKKWKKSS